MSNLEKKLDALMQLVLAEDEASKEEARAALRSMRRKNAAVQAFSPENEVRNLLSELGMPENIKGHRYTVKAVMLVLEDEDILDYITKALYPMVGEVFGTTDKRVERAIRHAVENTWDRGDIDILDKYFGNSVSINKGKPTNSEFIARIANIVRMRMKEAA